MKSAMPRACQAWVKASRLGGGGKGSPPGRSGYWVFTTWPRWRWGERSRCKKRRYNASGSPVRNTVTAWHWQRSSKASSPGLETSSKLFSRMQGTPASSSWPAV